MIDRRAFLQNATLHEFALHAEDRRLASRIGFELRLLLGDAEEPAHEERHVPRNLDEEISLGGTGERRLPVPIEPGEEIGVGCLQDVDRAVPVETIRRRAGGPNLERQLHPLDGRLEAARVKRQRQHGRLC